VFIPAGQTTPATTPEVEGSNIGVATVTASASGYLTVARQVPVTATITISPQTLQIPVGGSQILALVLSAAAPSIGVPITPDRAANGFVSGMTVQLSSSNPSVATVQPTVQFYPDGSSITTVVVVINGVSTGTAVIHVGAPPFIPDTTATVVVGAGSTTPVSLRAVSGTPQSAQVGSPFGIALSVLALDSSANPVSGVTVTFTGPSGGAGITFGSGTTAVTDSSGIARLQGATANGLPGTYQVLAAATGVPTSATFSLTNILATPSTISLPTNVTVGPNQSVAYPIVLSAPAPAGGIQITLSSSDPSKAIIAPSLVFVSAGATTPGAQPLVTGVNFGSTMIGASAPAFASGSQLLQVGASLIFSPPSITVSGTATQAINLLLSSPAPAGGLNVSLASTNSAIATVPSSVFFPAGGTSASVSITGMSGGNAVVNATAAAPNVTPAAANVTVNSGADITMAAGVVLGPGETALLPVFLSSPARQGGVAVGLASANTSVVTINPDNLYFPAGATAPFTQPQLSGIGIGSATVTASAYGLSGATQTVRVVGKLSGPSAQSLQQGVVANATFVLSWTATAPVTLSLTSTNPAVATVPSTLTIPSGGATVVVPVKGIGPGTTVIRLGALPDVSETTMSVTVLAEGTISLSGGVSVPLGQAAALPISLGTPAPAGGLIVSLSSSDASTVQVTPATLFFPAGSIAAPAQVIVIGSNIGVASITASAPGYLTATQQVPVTATITASPSSLVVPAGSKGLISMMLSAPAPSVDVPVTPDRAANGYVNGLTVNLSSSNPSVASVQPSVQFYSDGSSVTTVVVVVNGLAPGTAIIHASALPSIPDATVTVTVQ